MGYPKLKTDYISILISQESKPTAEWLKQMIVDKIRWKTIVPSIAPFKLKRTIPLDKDVLYTCSFCDNVFLFYLDIREITTWNPQ